jgi:environmental stress-induced protein Ves
MSPRDFAQVLVLAMREDMDSMADSIARGQCTSYEEYKRCVGVLQGYKLSLQHIETVMQKLEKDDE